MHKGIAWIALWLGVMTVGGCAWIDDVGAESGSARFEISGAEGCLARQFPMTYVQFQTDDNKADVRIRMYRSVSRIIDQSFMAVTFPRIHSETLETCPDIETLVGTTTEITPGGCVRVTLALPECSSLKTLRVTGTLELSEFSTARGERVEGALSGTLSHVRQVTSITGTVSEVVTDVGAISGTFGFNNHQSAVWENR